MISTVYVVAVHVLSKLSSTPFRTNVPLWPSLSVAKKIWVPLKPSEVTSTPLNSSNSCVVKLDVPLTITRVSLSVAVSKPSIVTVKAPSSETPASETSYLNSSASDVAVRVVSSVAVILTTV